MSDSELMPNPLNLNKDEKCTVDKASLTCKCYNIERLKQVHYRVQLWKNNMVNQNM